jgi:hypothetical protein
MIDLHTNVHVDYSTTVRVAISSSSTCTSSLSTTCSTYSSTSSLVGVHNIVRTGYLEVLLLDTVVVVL